MSAAVVGYGTFVGVALQAHHCKRRFRYLSQFSTATALDPDALPKTLLMAKELRGYVNDVRVLRPTDDFKYRNPTDMENSMELSIIRSLMDKSFTMTIVARNVRNACSARMGRSSRQSTIAMDRYERTVSPDEIEALFMSDNPTLTTAQKQGYASLFAKIKGEEPMGSDVAQEVLSKLFQQVVGEDVPISGSIWSRTQPALSPCAPA